MKTKILLFLFISALLFSCNSCLKNTPPTIEITNEVPDTGWVGNTLKYNILIKSKEPPISFPQKIAQLSVLYKIFFNFELQYYV